MPFIAEPRGEAVPTVTPSGVGPAPVPVDNSPLPEIAMVAIKIYAFGGLAFMIGIIVAALSYWTWIVVIKREFADSPPELDLHPERMRKREIARIARLKAEKDRKTEERQRREQEKFTPPPILYEKKDNRNRASSMPLSVKPVARNPTLPNETARPRKSSISTSPSKGNKRVSWASSTSTLDVNGNASVKPLEEKSVDSARTSLTESTFLPLPSHENILNHIPRARTSAPRLSTSLEPRARHGQEMIAATTPDMAISWAKPGDPFVRNCSCSKSVDPLDISRSDFCEMHRHQD